MTTAPTTIHRSQILDAGRAGRPWAFLPLAVRALEVAPEDAELGLLAAEAFGAVGLRTAASELAERLPSDPSTDRARLDRLRARLGALPPDRIPMDVLEGRVRRAIEAMGTRAGSLPEQFEAWRSAASRCEWFASIDGNVVRRGADGRWIGLADARAQAEHLARTHFVNLGEFPRPMVVEGIDPPWALVELLSRTPPTITGYSARVFVVQTDAPAFMNGLAQADLAEAFASGRIEPFIGPDAVPELERWMLARTDIQLVGPSVSLGSGGAASGLAQALARVKQRQLEECDRLAARVNMAYAPRDGAWWRARYEHARSGGPALRVLIPTCRFSTYIRHSSADLARALESLGCVTRVLIEPDAHSSFSKVAYQRAMAEFEPDLVVVINYTREGMGSGIPASVPTVCWIQDALPTLFREQTGRGLGPLDFVAGHLHSDLFELYGFPLERAIPTPVVAGEAKFHDGPADPALESRHACEIAYVSHQSETTEAMRDRFVREVGQNASVARLIEALYPDVIAIASDTMGRRTGTALRECIERTVARLGGRPDPALVSQVYNQVAMPLAERHVRHRVLGWAAAVAARRGWRLKLYGRGWERHPALAPFASGLLEHGEDLRASYRAARVHLHMSANAIVHQRVMECAMSGGLAVRLLTLMELDRVRLRAVGGLVRDASVDHVNARGVRMFAAADSAGSLGWTRTCQHAGLPARHMLNVSEELERQAERMRRYGLDDMDPTLLLGDLAETTFTDEASLERLIEKAVGDREWRSSLSAGIRRRAIARYSMEGLARRLIGRIEESLGGAVARRAA